MASVQPLLSYKNFTKLNTAIIGLPKSMLLPKH